MLTTLDPVVTLLVRGLDYIGPIILPPPRGETTVRLEGGHILLLPPGLPSARRLRAGLYEPEVTNVVRSHLGPGMTFVDAGASVGYYTLLAARLVGVTGRVYSFEPEATVHGYLELNVARSGARNVTTVRKAVTNKAGSALFVPSALEGSFVGADPMHAGSELRVDTVSLDSFFAQHGWPQVDMIKLDVEGAEGSVLMGMAELSKRSPNLRLVMEFNLRAMQRAGQAPGDLSQALLRLGFRSAYVIELRRESIPLTKPLPHTGLVYNLLISKS